jgi:hypothetical protein
VRLERGGEEWSLLRLVMAGTSLRVQGTLKETSAVGAEEEAGAILEYVPSMAGQGWGEL